MSGTTAYNLQTPDMTEEINMGKHRAPGRAANRLPVPAVKISKHALHGALHSSWHIIALCFHTTVAVILVEKTPLLIVLGLAH